jgi:hypothetical protein
MRVLKTIFILATAGAAAMGCGSSDNTCTDAGCPDGSVTTDDAGASDASSQMLWGLTRGTTMYTVTSVTAPAASDGCMLGPSALMGMDIPASYDETTNTFSFGKAQGTPAMPAFGAGKIGANMATLTRTNTAGEAMGCYWTQMDTSLMKLTNHDTFTLDVTEVENAFAPACTGADAPPAGGTCTSSFQLGLVIKK